MKVSGNSRDGYILHTGTQPYFSEECVKDLLTLVPSTENPDKSVWEAVREHEIYTRPINRAKTHAIRQSEEGPRRVEINRLHTGAKLRMDLIRFILENERSLYSKRISDVFDEAFFGTTFWNFWSST